MNVAKFDIKSCGHVTKHFERGVEPGHYSNTDIDDEKTELNYNLAPNRENGQVAYINNMLNNIDHVNRKDLVVMCSVVVDAPRNLPDSMHDIFFEETYNFLVDRYGSVAGFENREDVVVSCYRHRDETTDHIHFAFCPIKMDENGHQRFIAKEVVGRDDLKTLHQDLSQYLEEKNIHAAILNGRTQKDAYGRALSVREMKARDYSRGYTYERGRF